MRGYFSASVAQYSDPSQKTPIPQGNLPGPLHRGASPALPPLSSTHGGEIDTTTTTAVAAASLPAQVGATVGASDAFRHLDGATSTGGGVAEQSFRPLMIKSPPSFSPPSKAPPSVVPMSQPVAQLRPSWYYTSQGALLPLGMTKRALGRFRRIWCCTATEDSWHVFIIAIPILFFTLVFLISVVPRDEWISHVIGSILAFLSLSCLVLSVTIDPGILPPAPLQKAPGRSNVVIIRGRPVECKVCPTCHILRPPRSSHCPFCDVCVEEFDHHCGVLGSCVAKRTFRFFCGFFVFTAALALFILIRSFVVVVTTDFQNAQESPPLLWMAVASVLCLIGSFIGVGLVLPCAGRYVYLGCLNTTQKEVMRSTSGGCCTPNELYDEGYCQNFCRRFFGPIGPSVIPNDYYV